MTKLGVIRTSSDALTSKWSAVATDYFSYPELEHFVEEKTRRQPLINRGYCLRFEAMTQALTTFITAVLSSSLSEPVQIVNLGCGFDPLFFMIQGRLMLQNSGTRLRYYELDYEEVLRRKAEKVRTTPGLAERTGVPMEPPTPDLVRTDVYKMLPHDLEDAYGLLPGLCRLGLSLEAPVFWITECVLSYISDHAVDTMLREVMRQCAKYCIFSYEVFNVTDRFGRTMRDNFLRRNCEIRSTARFRSTQEIKSHLTTLCDGKLAAESPTMLPRDIISRHVAFPTTSTPRIEVVSMDEYYLYYLSPVERFRIEQLELFDELEEWRLIQEHYFVSSICNIIGLEPLRRHNSGADAKRRTRFDTEELVGVSHENILIRTAQNLIKDEDDNQDFMMTLKSSGIRGWIHTAPRNMHKSTLFHSAPNFKPSSSSCESMPSNASYSLEAAAGAGSPTSPNTATGRQRCKTSGRLSALNEEPPSTIAELLGNTSRSFF